MNGCAEKIQDTMFEGITPGLNALSRYIREVDSPEHLDRSKFATAFTSTLLANARISSTSYQPYFTKGDPEKVVHYLVSGNRDALRTFRRAIDYALGMDIRNMRNSEACEYEALRLSNKEKDMLRAARDEMPLKVETAISVMETIPNILSICKEKPYGQDVETSIWRSLSHYILPFHPSYTG